MNLVLPSDSGGVESHSTLYHRVFRPLQVTCGIVGANGKAKYGLHALRHFCASQLIEQGFTPKRLQAILGHSSIQMTYDVYGHLFPSPEDDQAKMAAAELSVVG